MTTGYPQVRRVLRETTAEHPPRIAATPEQQALWQRFVDAEYDVWPELREAKQPERPPFEFGAWSFEPAAEFAKHSEGFKLRAPLTDAELAGVPFHRALGSCLFPLIREGDLIYVDPQATPQHGDLVDVLLHVDFWARLNPDAYGNRPAPFIGKVLHQAGPVHWCLYNTGCFQLADHKIMGVVRRVVRDGQRIFE